MDVLESDILARCSCEGAWLPLCHKSQSPLCVRSCTSGVPYKPHTTKRHCTAGIGGRAVSSFRGWCRPASPAPLPAPLFPSHPQYLLFSHPQHVSSLPAMRTLRPHTTSPAATHELHVGCSVRFAQPPQRCTCSPRSHAPESAPRRQASRVCAASTSGSTADTAEARAEALRTLKLGARLPLAEGQHTPTVRCSSRPWADPLAVLVVCHCLVLALAAQAGITVDPAYALGATFLKTIGFTNPAGEATGATEDGLNAALFQVWPCATSMLILPLKHAAVL